MLESWAWRHAHLVESAWPQPVKISTAEWSIRTRRLTMPSAAQISPPTRFTMLPQPKAWVLVSSCVEKQTCASQDAHIV